MCVSKPEPAAWRTHLHTLPPDTALAAPLCHPQVIFTDPYYAAQHNRHTSPQLDADVAQLHADVAARVAASRLKVLGCLGACAIAAAGPNCVDLHFNQTLESRHGACLNRAPLLGHCTAVVAMCVPPTGRPCPSFPRAAPPLQAKFIEQQQALLHGDLHTGSIMATGKFPLPRCCACSDALFFAHCCGTVYPSRAWHAQRYRV